MLPLPSAHTLAKLWAPWGDEVILYDLLSLTSNCFSQAEREILFNLAAVNPAPSPSSGSDMQVRLNKYAVNFKLEGFS